MIVARALSTSPFAPGDDFLPRHMGSQGAAKQMMLDYIGFSSLEELTESTVPSQIRMEGRLDLDPPQTESEAINNLNRLGLRKIAHPIINHRQAHNEHQDFTHCC